MAGEAGVSVHVLEDTVSAAIVSFAGIPVNLSIHPANPDIHYSLIAQMVTDWFGHVLTLDDLLEDDAVFIEGKIHQWLVAYNSQQQLVAIAHLARYPSEPAGRFHGYLIVKSEWQHQGVGAALYEHLQALMNHHQAAEWHSRVNEGDASSLHFAQKRGFSVTSHIFDSSLDLTTFDETPFQGLVSAVAAIGIRFFPFSSVSHDPRAQRKLYEINRLAGLDEPTTDSFAPFDTWQKVVLNASWFHHDCEFVATAGERYVGLSGAFPTADPLIYENGFTGVDPAYRGRKIAQALKILAIRHALARNAREIRTGNDSRNVPMLAINRKLGYRPLPGHFGIVKQIGSST